MSLRLLAGSRVSSTVYKLSNSLISSFLNSWSKVSSKAWVETMFFGTISLYLFLACTGATFARINMQEVEAMPII